MTTVYFICVCFAVDLGHARREHRRGVRRGAFSTRRNFLATCIRQRQCFSLLRQTLALEALRPAVLLTLLAETPLVASTRSAVTGRPSVVAAWVAAVVLSTIVRPADEERHEAPRARRLVNNSERVQGSGRARQKLGCGPEPWDDCFVEARLRAYGRRLELVTRAFTLFGAPRSSSRRSVTVRGKTHGASRARSGSSPTLCSVASSGSRRSPSSSAAS
jgi:hypothetical protein